AMADTVDEVGPALPRGTHRLVRLAWLATEEQQLPDAEPATDREREVQKMVGRAAGNCRQGFEIREEIAQIAGRDVPVGRIGKRRIEMLARRRSALPERRYELRLGPRSDAVAGIGRDVGRVERAERGCEPEPAAELALVLLIRRGVTGRAAAGMEADLAVCRIRGVRPEVSRRHGLRDRQNPERARAHHKKNCNRDGELAEHVVSWRLFLLRDELGKLCP